MHEEKRGFEGARQASRRVHLASLPFPFPLPLYLSLAMGSTSMVGTRTLHAPAVDRLYSP